MNNKALQMTLWLIGTLCLLPLAGWAEVLTFKVYFGSIPAGKLWFEAREAEGGAYTIEANLEDSLPWVTFDDRLVASGVVKNGVYSANQYNLRLRENDYRADKLITFDRKKAKATYVNRLDPNDPKIALDAGPNVSDVLSTLWTLRQEPVDAFAKPRKMQVVGLKRVIDLTVANKGWENVRVKGKHQVAGFDGYSERLVRMELKAVDPAEPAKVDVWQIWVRPGKGTMVPVALSTKTKLGTFWAYLIP